ncbi:MAG: RNA polymerase sigma factor [Acidimicrobiales bacterium]
MRISPVAAAFRSEWSPLVAALLRQFGDLSLAEDCAQEAFVAASVAWPASGPPDRPGAWLLTTARRKAIDRLRRDRRYDARLADLAGPVGGGAGVAGAPSATADDGPAPTTVAGDDHLALLFGCCHPALDVETQVALTLRYGAGLSTAQIASAFQVPEPTMAKRLVRAKHKIRAAGVPIRVPDPEDRPERLDALCGVVYGILTEGHASASGAVLVRGNLCDEAVWLAETLARLAPAEPEVRGLAALCLLTDARRPARTDADGQPVLLADQDRGRWDAGKIERGLTHLAEARRWGRIGPYQLQARLAGLHAVAPSFAATDWDQVVATYDQILTLGDQPVVALNRAAAVAERDGPAAGLALIDDLVEDGTLVDYHYLHSARAELLRRLGRHAEADDAYVRALALTGNDAERRWLAHRREALSRP